MPAPISDSPQALEGIWQLIRAELDGEAAPELVVSKTKLAIGNGTYEVRFAGEIADQGTLEIGVTDGVHTIVLRGVKGPNAGLTIPSIYQLVGERLRICYGLDGVAPREFAAATGRRRYLATYRRVG